ncbi:MAG TPA: hypothetical protein VN832_02975 [Stellaceae bacterium]|nr:hypothetical protein [Stellaceae bacterium]
MRGFIAMLLLGAAALPLLADPAAAEQSRAQFGVTIGRGFVRAPGQFEAFEHFRHRFSSGLFQGYCCVSLPDEYGGMPGIVVINANLPPPPPPPIANLHMTVEKTAQGVTIVRGPAILP